MVELVVTIAVMAVLTAIIVPSMGAISENREKEKYKQYCLSILESADAIAEAYNNGAKSVAGYNIVSNNNEINWVGVRQCLETDNTYNYQCNVTVFRIGSPLGLTESGNTITTAFAQKDTVVVHFCFTDDKRMYASGCWYFEKNNNTAKYKYDYLLGAFISATDTFESPDMK